MIQLRDYQKQAVQSAIAKYKQCNPLIVSPTGSGKSLMIAELCRRLSHLKILVITPRVLLLEQNAKLIDNSGILSGSLRSYDTGHEHRVVCATYQTLISHKKMNDFDLFIIDETQLVPQEEESKYLQFLIENTIPKISLTATPYRNNALIYGKGKMWTKVFEIGITELIKQGYLTPPKSFKVPALVLNENYEQDIGACLDATIKKAKKLKLKRLVVFTRDIQTTEYIETYLRDADEKAYAIHSKLQAKDYNHALKSFKRTSKGRKWLVNVRVLTTGVDLPEIDALVLLNKYSELSLYVQVIGRGLRLYPDKVFCAVFDYAHNQELGYIDASTLESLVQTNKSNSQVERIRTCPECDYMNPPNAVTCEECGFEFLKHSRLKDHSHNESLLPSHINAARVDRITSEIVSKHVVKNIFHTETQEEVWQFISTEQSRKFDYTQKGKVIYEKHETGEFYILILFSPQ